MYEFIYYGFHVLFLLVVLVMVLIVIVEWLAGRRLV